MPLPRWALPESIQDTLPTEAFKLEHVRRTLLDALHLHGYEYVIPPTIEFLASLLSGTGHDMEDQIFKFVDPLCGQMLGIRADMTPQVTRLDAHVLNRRGVARLCYCGSVVNAHARALSATREPLQLGAEIYGHAGIEADVEIIRLLAELLQNLSVEPIRIDIGHVALFKGIIELAATPLNNEDAQALFAVLQSKDVPALHELSAHFPPSMRDALRLLPNLYGDANILIEARRKLPSTPQIQHALSELEFLHQHLNKLPLSFDLADLRGYHYHSGLVFAAYVGGASALALGGRYNEVGKAFGRARPATGFSLDLRELAQYVAQPAAALAVLAPLDPDPALQRAIADLRAQGNIVIQELPGHADTWHETGCTQRLHACNGQWTLVPIETP